MPPMPDPVSTARRQARLRRLSRAMAALCLALGAGVPLALAVYWLVAPTPAILAKAGLPSPEGGAVLGLPLRLAALAVSLVPVAVLLRGLMHARACFRAFAAGRIFAAEAVESLRGFAVAVFGATLLQPVAGAALSVLLSWGGPSGRGALVVSVGSDTLLSLLFAGTVAVMALVLAEALALADENAQFV
ncbi:DUF2975 domain-containing protein [Methylobacterium oryzisoli]|uniref:DUF2975 domain-containing protein n=1 Tax=Methylobacterium oryzisoli TaxID=3385502 RepID=UPI00389222BD